MSRFIPAGNIHKLEAMSSFQSILRPCDHGVVVANVHGARAGVGSIQRNAVSTPTIMAAYLYAQGRAFTVFSTYSVAARQEVGRGKPVTLTTRHGCIGYGFGDSYTKRVSV